MLPDQHPHAELGWALWLQGRHHLWLRDKQDKQSWTSPQHRVRASKCLEGLSERGRVSFQLFRRETLHQETPPPVLIRASQPKSLSRAAQPYVTEQDQKDPGLERGRSPRHRPRHTVMSRGCRAGHIPGDQQPASTSLWPMPHLERGSRTWTVGAHNASPYL